jgi:hypothetical protein
MPVTPDIDDDQLERLAQDKGVGALVKPLANRNRAGEGASAATDVAASKAASAAEEKPMASGATPRSRMKTVNLELPDYVWTDLKIRAAHAQTSVRHIVMAALRSHGVEIRDPDMVEDGRRLRS